MLCDPVFFFQLEDKRLHFVLTVDDNVTTDPHPYTKKIFYLRGNKSMSNSLEIFGGDVGRYLG